MDMNPSKKITSTLLLSSQLPPYERKRPLTEEENPVQKKRKWKTNGAIESSQRDHIYFVDPLPLSDPLLNQLQKKTIFVYRNIMNHQ
ncbi:hypothetical protein RCL_jg22101.t1 [Rhizophagus clarus]|uniref:Uncharacterized protein n=1 Tax=Rhizophagus clarus TaxID=94130 RepID=A0A8H3LK55_9GLOM|nr:hypothetical protein RCL_jg22101.t1 [Rhizophagus clarus]